MVSHKKCNADEYNQIKNRMRISILRFKKLAILATYPPFVVFCHFLQKNSTHVKAKGEHKIQFHIFSML